MSPTVEAELVVETASPRDAEIVAQALSPDSEGYLEVAVDGGKLVLSAKADSVMGLVRTLDDALASVAAAEGVGAVGGDGGD